MVTDNLSFPHPVLGLGDDIQGAFSLEINISRNKEKKTVEFIISNIIIENDYFVGLIERNLAGMLFKIQCSSTFKTWVFKSPIETFEIPEDDLCNKVEIQPLIIAFADIELYTDTTFNPEYGNYQFKVNKYEIIGMLGKITIPIDKNYERLSLGNIFDFSPEDDCNKPCSFEFIADKIIIKYPVTANGDDPPNGLFHKSPWAAYNILILPALTEAFRLMADLENRSAYEEHDWYFVLNSLLPETERDEDPYKNAQLILNKQIPVLKAFDELCIN